MKIYDETRPYIFISYAHKDSEQVYRIMNYLKDAGYNVWYDGGIDPGTEWDENIAKHVKGCSYFIGFISKNYIASHNCKDELNFARDLDKERLLVYLEDVELPSGMAMRMNRIQAIFWNKYATEEEACEKLFSAKGIEKTHESAEVKPEVVNTPVTPTTPDHMTLGGEVSKAAKPGLSLKKILPFAIGGVAVIAAIIVGIFLFAKPNKVEQGIQYLYSSEKIAYDPVKALEIFEEEAAKGNQEAAYLASYTMLFDLRHTKYYDMAAAMDYLTQCDDSNPYALDLEGLLIQAGYDGHRDTEKADALWEERRQLADEDTLKSDKPVYHAQTAVVLGYLYAYGCGCKKDEGLTRSWYDYAADQGSVYALENLGLMYATSAVSDADYSRAIGYVQKAIDKGRALANNTMGVIYSKGDEENGVERDDDKALKYYELAAEAGNGIAMSNLAHCYRMGLGYVKNSAKAIEWYEKAIDNGYREALYKLGNLYYDGNDDLEEDFAKAAEYMERGLTAGLTEGAFELGYMYGAGGYGLDADMEKSVKYYTMAMETGSAIAAYNLGVLYSNGTEGIEQDISKAVDYYEKSAEMGYAQAHYSLGNIYYDGVGDSMEPDYVKAATHFTAYIEADRSDADQLEVAAFNLGTMLAAGVIDRDEEGHFYEDPEEINGELACQYYEIGAGTDAVSCMIMLAYCYANGQGVEIDCTKAQEWYDRILTSGQQLEESQRKVLEDIAFAIEIGSLDSKQLADRGKNYEGSDNELAVKYWKASADRGDYDYSIYIVGWMYSWASWAENDWQEGYKYLSRNADSYALSARCLGDWYADKRNPSYSYDSAKEWYNKALELGYDAEKIADCLANLEKNKEA